MKTCRVCGEKRPLEEFRKGHNRCKGCTAVARRAYRVANLERERENDRRWYAANSAAKIEYRRQYDEANREEIGKRRRKWYEENRASERARNLRRYWEDPERRREHARRWSREHPVENAAKAAKRRAVDLTITQADVAFMSVLRRDLCAYCGGDAGTVDHIEPLSGGGNGGWENLTASCRSCNASKGTATLLTFLATRA